jgi:serine/threonine-protein kinase
MTNCDPSQVRVRPGDILAGKYRVERVLGVGGMGVVVAAHHIHLDETVALKFLLAEALDNPEAVARFVREARAAVKIKSEHVARVSDVGELDDGTPYMVMEYLAGSDLSEWLRQHGPMPVEVAVDFVLQACEAIVDAHVLGIVHRDLKPANLFCVRRNDGQLSIKVLDFGISKIVTAGIHGPDMTSTAAVVGSPMYMSPEQLQSSKGVDLRTDIWSLGVILFELLTGRLPFEAPGVTELIIKIAIADAPPIRSVRHDVPAGLEQAIARCFEKDRERRFASIGELAIALKDFGSGSALASVERILGTLRMAGVWAAEPLVTGAVRAQAPIPQTMATWNTARAATSRPWVSRPLVWIGIAMVMTAAGAGAAAFLRRASVRSLSAETSVPTMSPPPEANVAMAAPSLEVERLDPPRDVTPSAASAAEGPLPRVAPLSGEHAEPSRPAPAAATRAAVRWHRPPDTVTSAASSPPADPAASGSSSPGMRPSNCSPPFVIDSAGHRQYKPECL